jgi:hypothetical protein
VNDGFWSVLVFPSPNVQFHVVGEFVEVSVNCTVSGTDPDAGVAVNAATGADATGALVVVM